MVGLARTRVLIVGAAFTLLMTACGGSSTGSATSGEVAIGGVCDLSGALILFGQACQDGLTLGVKQINDAGGFKVGNAQYKFKLTLADAQSTTTATVAAATGLIQDTGVKFVFGPETSGDALPMIGAVKGLNVVDFSGGSSAATVVSQPGYENIFAVVAAASAWEPSVLLALKAFGVTSGQIGVAYPNDANTVQARVVEGYLNRGGYKAAEYLFPPSTTDFRPLVTKMESDGAVALVVGYGSAQDYPFATALAELGGTKGLVGIGGLPGEVPNKLAHNTGKPFPVPYASLLPQTNLDQPTSPGMEQVRKLYVTATGKDPSTLYATQVFPWFMAPVHILSLAMQKANSVTDVQAIAKAVLEVKYDGPIPNYHFGSDHVAVYGTDWALVVNGKTTWTYVPPAASS